MTADTVSPIKPIYRLDHLKIPFLYIKQRPSETFQTAFVLKRKFNGNLLAPSVPNAEYLTASSSIHPQAISLFTISKEPTVIYAVSRPMLESRVYISARREIK